MSVPGRATCWIPGSASNGRKNLKRFAGSAEVFEKSLSPALELAREVDADLPGTTLAQGLLKRVLKID